MQPNLELPTVNISRLACPLILACAALLTPCAMGEEKPAPIKLTERARALHKESLLIDGHNDLPWELRKSGSADFTKIDIAQRQDGKTHTDLPRLREGNVGAQFWSVWVPTSTTVRGTALSTTLEQIELVKLMIRQYPADFELALSTADIESCRAKGKIASLIGIEGGHCIEDSIPVLQRLYKLGARYMTLTHSDTLKWADSATDDPKHGGLTEFGRDIVREMNRLGMIIDLSHVSTQVMHQTLDISTAPVIFSHSSARAIADHPRNVPDDVLKRLPKNGGVVMVNFYSGFVVPEAAQIALERFDVSRKLRLKHTDESIVDRELDIWDKRHPSPSGTIHDVLDHIDHIAKTAGVAHVGIGSDFDGISKTPRQLEDVSRYPYLTQGLLDRGYSDTDIKKILGENMMRAFRGAEQAAGKQTASR